MLEALGIRTWEMTLLVVAGFVMWGLLRERSRRKHIRNIRGENQILAKDLLVRATSYGKTDASVHGSNYAPAGSYDSNPILPISGDPANTDDRFISAAIGMESNRQDFYRQAWEASRNNEYTSMKPGSW